MSYMNVAPRGNVQAGKGNGRTSTTPQIMGDAIDCPAGQTTDLTPIWGGALLRICPMGNVKYKFGEDASVDATTGGTLLCSGVVEFIPLKTGWNFLSIAEATAG